MKAAIPVTGAFLAVAFADGRYDPSEEGRFLGTIANDPALSCINTTALQSAYNELRRAFESDYSGALARVLAAISAVKDDAVLSAAVKVAARGGVVADQVVAPQEEIMLDRIAEALGLEKGTV